MGNSKLVSIMFIFFGLSSLIINFGMIYVNIIEWFFIIGLSLVSLIMLIMAWLVLQEKSKQRKTMLSIQKLIYIFAVIIIIQSVIYLLEKEYSVATYALTSGLSLLMLARYGIRAYFEQEEAREKMSEREKMMGKEVETKSGNIILIILSIMFLANLILKFFQ